MGASKEWIDQKLKEEETKTEYPELFKEAEGGKEDK